MYTRKTMEASVDGNPQITDRKSRFWRFPLFGAMFFCWLVEGLSYPHSTFPDGIAYLDIAQACFREEWNALVNGYWSPGYPFLLSCWFFIFKPSPAHELVAAHVCNCIILLAALFCLEYFLNGIDVFLNVHAGSRNMSRFPCGRFEPWGTRYFPFVLCC